MKKDIVRSITTVETIELEKEDMVSYLRMMGVVIDEDTDVTVTFTCPQQTYIEDVIHISKGRPIVVTITRLEVGAADQIIADAKTLSGWKK